MKIHIVKAPSGEYEDYQELIVKVFLDKKKAKQYVKEENGKLPLAQSKLCAKCQWKWQMRNVTQEKPKCYNPDDLECYCNNYFQYRDVQALFMEEYEVEDEN